MRNYCFYKLLIVSIINIVSGFYNLTCAGDLPGNFKNKRSFQGEASKADSKGTIDYLEISGDNFYIGEAIPTVSDSIIKGDFSALIQKATYFWELNQNDSAYQYLSQAHILNTKPDSNTHVFADYLALQGSFYAHNQNARAAFYFLNKSIQCRPDFSPPNPSTLFKTYNNLGVIYMWYSRYQKALSYLFEAEQLNKNHNKKVDTSYLFSMYENIGLCYKYLKQDDSANVFLKKVIQLSQKKHDQYLGSVANAYLNLGWIATNNENYRQARFYYDSSLYIFDQLEQPSNRRLFLLFQNYGTNCLLTGELKKAEQLYNMALSKATGPGASGQMVNEVRLNLANIYLSTREYPKAIGQYRYILSSDDNVLKLKAYRNLARTYEKTGQTDSAAHIHELNTSQSAIKIYQPGEIALNHLYYGYFLIQNNRDSERAITELKKAESYFLKNNELNSRDLAECYINMGIYFARKQEYNSAKENINKSLRILKSTYGQTGQRQLIKNAEDSKTVRAYYQMGNIYMSQYNEEPDTNFLGQALTNYNKAIDILESVRFGLQNDESKMNYSSRSRLIYSKAIECLFEVYNVSQSDQLIKRAFELAEKSKASTLLEAINRNETEEQLEQHDSLIRMGKQLRVKLSEINQRTEAEKQKVTIDSVLIAQLINASYEIMSKIDSLDQIVSNALKQRQLEIKVEILPADSILNQMRGNTAMIEYVFSERKLFAFVFFDGKLSIKYTPVDSTFHSQLNLFRDQISHFPGEKVQQELSNFINASNYLYKKLIPNELEVVENLIIIPDGDLSLLAFEALSKTEPSENPSSYRELNYLIRDHGLVYNYLATLHFRKTPVRSKGLKELNKIIAFAPDYPQNQDEGSTEYNRLKWVKAEVDSLNTIFGAKTFKNTEATKENFIDRAADYSILHLAMHAIADEEMPENSHLVFYQNPDNASDDYKLHIYEIYHQSLNAHLAVLSSCNTGFGKMAKGEGILSLARSFAYTGTQHIIMALWEIEDKTGARIITDFYHRLSKGYSPNEAIRESKLNYLQSAPNLFAHPYFWAAYVSVGKPVTFDPDVFEKEKTDKLLVLSLSVGALLMVMILLLIKKRYKS